MKALVIVLAAGLLAAALPAAAAIPKAAETADGEVTSVPGPMPRVAPAAAGRKQAAPAAARSASGKGGAGKPKQLRGKQRGRRN